MEVAADDIYLFEAELHGLRVYGDYRNQRTTINDPFEGNGKLGFEKKEDLCFHKRFVMSVICSM